jgi:enamine deaminase RidA (YjgF/YER057c/UK114 family)
MIDALLVMADRQVKAACAQVCSPHAAFEAHNAAWNAWVDRRNPPVRACVRADLVRPGLLVEIMAIAAPRTKGEDAHWPRAYSART